MALVRCKRGDEEEVVLLRVAHAVALRACSTRLRREKSRSSGRTEFDETWTTQPRVIQWRGKGAATIAGGGQRSSPTALDHEAERGIGKRGNEKQGQTKSAD